MTCVQTLTRAGPTQPACAESKTSILVQKFFHSTQQPKFCVLWKYSLSADGMGRGERGGGKEGGRGGGGGKREDSACSVLLLTLSQKQGC